MGPSPLIDSFVTEYQFKDCFGFDYVMEIVNCEESGDFAVFKSIGYDICYYVMTPAVARHVLSRMEEDFEDGLRLAGMAADIGSRAWENHDRYGRLQDEAADALGIVHAPCGNIRKGK